MVHQESLPFVVELWVQDSLTPVNPPQGIRWKSPIISVSVLGEVGVLACQWPDKGSEGRGTTFRDRFSHLPARLP
jgi:hypothetical protein